MRPMNVIAFNSATSKKVESGKEETCRERISVNMMDDSRGVPKVHARSGLIKDMPVLAMRSSIL